MSRRVERVLWVMAELGCRDEDEGFHHCTTHWTWPCDFIEGGEWLCPTAAKIVDGIGPCPRGHVIEDGEIQCLGEDLDGIKCPDA